MHEFPIFDSHTEWNLLFLRGELALLDRNIAYHKQIIIINILCEFCIHMTKIKFISIILF